VSVVALELHDAGLLVVGDADVSVARVAPSPGYALIDGESVLTGSAAASRARLRPRLVHNRFWDGLDSSPLERPFPRQISVADLAHAHLSQLWELVGDGVDEVILVASGSYTGEQLGLALGIARTCGMPVRGMVDSAVAAASHGAPGGRLLHLDLHLHRTVVTEVTATQDVVRGRVDAGERSGLVALQDALARRISQLFLRDTRFDPLHAAETEQRLYAGLPHWLARLHRDDGFALRFESAGREYSVELTRDRLAPAVDQAYERLARIISSIKQPGEPTTVLLGHRAAMLPGLEARLAEIANTGIVPLGETAAPAGAITCMDRIRAEGDELPFVTRLPLRPGPAPGPPPTVQAPPAPEGRPGERQGPTHLLLDSVAHPITDEPLVLGVAVPAGTRGVNLEGPNVGVSRSHCSVYRRGPEVLVEDHSSHGSFVNGIEGRSLLAVGDRLRLGSPGFELRLIRLAKNDGSPQG